MDHLVLAIQLLSFALVLFGGWLCVLQAHREWKETLEKSDAKVEAADAAESDLQHGTPA